jgi:intraflagellar transport protein 46
MRGTPSPDLPAKQYTRRSPKAARSDCSDGSDSPGDPGLGRGRGLGSDSDKDSSSSDEESSELEESEAEAQPPRAVPASARGDAIEEAPKAGESGPTQPAKDPNEYDAAEILSMPVFQLLHDDAREIFRYITSYQPQSIELEARIKPFVPDFIPAIGALDTFCSVPRPDGVEDGLGLAVLAEPCSKQSDAKLVEMELRAFSKVSSGTSHDDAMRIGAVHAIEGAEKEPEKVQGWIDAVRDLQRRKPATDVCYKRPMPDVETLMQVWPEEFERLLQAGHPLPGGDLDLDLGEMVTLCCVLLDIPVYERKTDSLHVLFTLFVEFNSNQHFSNQQEQQGGGGRSTCK